MTREIGMGSTRFVCCWDKAPARCTRSGSRVRAGWLFGMRGGRRREACRLLTRRVWCLVVRGVLRAVGAFVARRDVVTCWRLSCERSFLRWDQSDFSSRSDAILRRHYPKARNQQSTDTKGGRKRRNNLTHRNSSPDPIIPNQTPHGLPHPIHPILSYSFAPVLSARMHALGIECR